MGGDKREETGADADSPMDPARSVPWRALRLDTYEVGRAGWVALMNRGEQEERGYRGT